MRKSFWLSNETVLRRVFFLLAAMIIHAAVSQTIAAPADQIVPPANDNFANAAIVGPFGTFNATNVEATGEAGEPVHGSGYGGSGAERNSIWIKYTAASNGVFVVWTGGAGASPIGDTVLSAYTGSSVNALTAKAGNDDYPALNLYSKITFGVIAGQTYHIAADGFGATVGTFVINYQFFNSAPNDNFTNAEILTSGPNGPATGITGATVGATGENGEPDHNGDVFKTSVWYNWSTALPRSVTFTTAGSDYDTVIAVYTGSAINALSMVTSNDDFGVPGDLTSTVTFYALPGTTYRIAVDGFATNTGTFTLNWAPNSFESRKRFNFDGDSKSDIGIFRPSNGQWWITQSLTSNVYAATFGVGTDKPTPADFTGDGKTDIAFWRPANGMWYVLRSQDFSFYAYPFGSNGDVPAAGQFDTDRSADSVVFRPSTATWYISRSKDGSTDIIQFGVNGDVPVVADYDGDGVSDLAIYRPSNGQWWLRQSKSGVIAMVFGNNSDKPVPGDFTGDGRSDVAFWRPSTGFWYVLRSEDSSFYAFPFGISTDIPAPADYTSDYKFDAAVFRPSTGTWYIAPSSGAATIIQPFGTSGDRPVASSFIP